MDNAVANVVEADQAFFDALLNADAEALETLLTDDFTIVDVMSGGVHPRDAFIGGVGSRMVVFEEIEVVERAVREYADCAIVVGRTRMRGAFGGAPFGAHSRYTHVFVRQCGGWKLASAQGTPISAGSGSA